MHTSSVSEALPELGQQQIAPTHTVWLINEHSTHAQEYLETAREAYAAQPDKTATWLPTTEDNSDVLKLRAKIAENDSVEVVVGSGDGFMNKLVSELLRPEPCLAAGALALKKVIISKVGFGNKCDGDRDLHGPAFRDLNTIRRSKPIPVHPLIIQKRSATPELGQQDWEYVGAAVNYIGLGATAIGALKANHPDYRAINQEHPRTLFEKLKHIKDRCISDLNLAWAALKTVVNLKSHGRINGLNVFNSDRMAGGLLRSPTHLGKREFFVSVTKRNPLSILRGLLDRGKGFSGQLVRDSDYYFETENPMLMQADGETSTLEPGSYKISQSETGILFRAARRRNRGLKPQKVF